MAMVLVSPLRGKEVAFQDEDVQVGGEDGLSKK
jgi:hypothetical protein